MEDQILCLHNLMLFHCCQISNAICTLCIWSITDRIVPWFLLMKTGRSLSTSMKLQPCKNCIRGWRAAASNFGQTVSTLMGAETGVKSWQSSTEQRATLF